MGGSTYVSDYWIKRLNADDGFDPTFKRTLPTNVRISSLVLQSNGNVLVLYVDRTGAPGLTRLGPDGVPDPGFNPPAVLGNFDAYLMTVQPDGSILIYGGIRFANQQPGYRLVRLRPDGSVDAGFNSVVDSILRERKFTNLPGRWANSNRRLFLVSQWCKARGDRPAQR